MIREKLDKGKAHATKHCQIIEYYHYLSIASKRYSNFSSSVLILGTTNYLVVLITPRRMESELCDNTHPLFVLKVVKVDYSWVPNRRSPSPCPLLLINFSIFFQDILIPILPLSPLINYSRKFSDQTNFLKQYTYADFFAISQKK